MWILINADVIKGMTKKEALKALERAIRQHDGTMQAAQQVKAQQSSHAC